MNFERLLSQELEKHGDVVATAKKKQWLRYM
jgi:hypothetical protein